MNWMETNFYIPETRNDPLLRGRLKLQPYQADVLREALHRDENDNFQYSIVVWSDIKKSIKSTIAAAVNLYRAEHTEWGEFFIIANDLKQADSRVAHYLRRCLQLNPELGKKYSQRGYRTTGTNGSFLEAIPIDPSGEAGSNADQLTFCLDEQTEVLTFDGWKTWETLCEDDWIATRSPSEAFEWQKPTGIFCSDYTGEMVRISHRSVDALVTPDHRLYGKFVGGRGIAPAVDGCWSHEFVNSLENRFLEAKYAIQTKSYYPALHSHWEGGEADWFIVPATIGKPSGKILQPEKKVHPMDYAAFMGWYLSEGCTIKKRGGFDGFAIGQSTKNHENRDEIIALLKRMGFTPHLWAGGMNIVVYHSVFGKYLSQFGLSDEKYIPVEIKNMPRKYLEAFLSAFIKGDGHVNKFGGILLSTRSPQMRDDLAEIAQKLGYSISSAEHADKRWKLNPVMYSLYLRSPDFGRKMTKVERNKFSIENYSGVVFCPSTPNGVIYVRRNGTYYWTGNSELWGANEKEKQRMWSEATLSPTKRGKSFRWVESYAGFTEESQLLYSLYDLGVKQGELLWPERLYEVTDGSPTPLELYVNRDAGMLCLWNTQPRCPWQTKDYYREEAKILLPNEFQRMHRNQWVTSEETFVPMEWYDACYRRAEEWPKIDVARHPMVIALDAAVSNDNFGLLMGCRHPEHPDDVLVWLAKVWKPGSRGVIDFLGTEENPGPERMVRRLAKEYNVIQITYDPYQLHDMSMRLKREGVAWVRPFNQGNDRLIADSQLRDVIRDRRLWHRGEPDLRDQVQNANAKVDEQDSKIRIVKRVERLKIDLAVCLSMCTHELLRLNLQ